MAVAAFAAAALIAIVAVPWDAGVAPWSDLSTDALSAFTTEQIARINEYVAAAWLPGVLALVAGPIVATVVALDPRLRGPITAIARSPRSTGRRVLADLIVASVVLAIVRLAVLPFAIWSAQVRREAGLLVEQWSAWWLRWLGESIVYVVLGALAVTVAMAVLRRWPRRGWIAVTPVRTGPLPTSSLPSP